MVPAPPFDIDAPAAQRSAEQELGRAPRGGWTGLLLSASVAVSLALGATLVHSLRASADGDQAVTLRDPIITTPAPPPGAQRRTGEPPGPAGRASSRAASHASSARCFAPAPQRLSSSRGSSPLGYLYEECRAPRRAVLLSRP